MIEWNYTLRFKSPVSVFSGMAIAGLVDRMIVRCREDLPFIPGSSVKGRWRFFAERLARSCALPPGLALHDANQPECKTGGKPCTICRLFGNSSIPALIWVGQAEPDEPFKSLILQLLDMAPNPVVHPDVELRPGIGISRPSRTTETDCLFFDEALPPIPFSGRVMIRESLSPDEETFLKASARLVDRIGARKAVGRGTLEGGIHIDGGAS